MADEYLDQLTAKTVAVGADNFLLGDSAAANVSKRITLADLRTSLFSLAASTDYDFSFGNGSTTLGIGPAEFTASLMTVAAPVLTGTTVVRQTGGVAGTDDLLLSHDGTNARIQPKSGYVDFLDSSGTSRISVNPTGGTAGQITSRRFLLVDQPANTGTATRGFLDWDQTYFRGTSGFKFAWTSSATDALGVAEDTALVRAAAGVVGVQGGSGAGGQLELLQVADVGTPSTNSVRFGAEDVAGTAEAIVSDEAGNETQISPHAADAPAAFYDFGTDTVIRSLNRYTGRVEFVNLSRVARLVEQMAATALPAVPVGRRNCFLSETLAAYGTRTGRAKTALDWQAVQDQHQARYDAARAAELTRHQQWTDDRQAWVAARTTERQAHDSWLALPPAVRARTPKPAVRPQWAVPEPQVRPAQDIRKARPARLG